MLKLVKYSQSYGPNEVCDIKTEEGYDKIVEEVSKRLEKNDLYIKPEKYV